MKKSAEPLPSDPFMNLKNAAIMFAYNFDQLNIFLRALVQKNTTPQAWEWLSNAGDQARQKGEMTKFNIAFVAMPRKTGKAVVSISPAEQAELKTLRKDFSIDGWAIDRLSRAWLLMQLDTADKSKYIAAIETLFTNAEMSELVALYGSLPLLAYPESWKKRCAEGIRSNIGQVLESVICNNPYPAEHLDEAAWNQMVLKAIFTEKPVLEIIGLRERRNATLARALHDYAHERWAAHRDVNPLLWICVSPFIDSGNFSDIQRVFGSENPLEREAAALVCWESGFEPARRLVEQDAALKQNIRKGRITWQAIAEQQEVM